MIPSSYWQEAVLIRVFEERLLEIFSQGKINGTVHTCIGQEMTGVIFANQLKPSDFVFSNHRGHGHFIAFTKNDKGLLAELMGKAQGVCAGIGGSQHLCHKNFFSNGVQGGMMPVAAGMALAQQWKGSDAVVTVFIGDGTLGEGVVYETLNIAALWNLPLLVVCENNYYAQSTRKSNNLAGDIRKRAEAFGITTFASSIWDEETLMAQARASIDLVRSQRRPVFHVVEAYRLAPHSKGDDLRDPGELAAYRQRDPLTVFAQDHPEDYAVYHREAQERVTAVLEDLATAEELPARDYLPPSFVPKSVGWVPLVPRDERQVDRINQFFKDAMSKSEALAFLGEDVLSPYGGAFKAARDLSSLFPDRVLTAPISEAAITGIGSGLALGGYRPFVEIMFGDFVTLALDQIVNHAAKFRQVYHQQVSCPLVLRFPSGGRRGYGPTHSQSLDKWVCGIPGTKAVALNVLIDPREVYERILQEDDPVMVIENKSDYSRRLRPPEIPGYCFERSDGIYPVVRVRPLASPADLTLVCFGGMVESVLKSLTPLFEELELRCELLVLTQLYPLDIRGVLESAAKTRRLFAAEEGCGMAGEILAAVMENLNGPLMARRISAPPVAVPAAHSLEAAVLPGEQHILQTIAEAFGL